MTEEGPQLEALTRRLSECPADFLAEPRTPSGQGEVVIAAVVSDLICELGGSPLRRQEAALFQGAPEDRNRLRLVLVACWLLYDPWFREGKRFAPQAYKFLAGDLGELASMARADAFVTSPDRREELARLCLKAVGLRPAGETDAQAEDRLTTISSIERARVVRAAREAQERARKIREAMARKAAEEAAASYGRD